MIEFKKYIASQIIGKKLRFQCDCIIKMDVVGVVVDYELISNEIVFLVDVNGKIIKIGENHPDLYIKEE
jgi:hypothetical protein